MAYRNVFIFSALAFLKIGGAASAVESAQQPNILFVAIDDLRPELGCYGSPLAKTPNIDRLARQGVLFERAYCQYTVCTPSRLAMLTGTHVERFGRIRDEKTPLNWRDFYPKLTSLPQVFRENGWYAKSIGKVYDNRYGLDDAASWSEPAREIWGNYVEPQNLETLRKIQKKELPWTVKAVIEKGINPHRQYGDERVCEAALDFLRSETAKQQPFFLAVGFAKPHLPFTAPKRFWDLYDPQTLPVLNEKAPENATQYTLPSYIELESYDVPYPPSAEWARKLIHGYLACVSFSDDHLGQLLTELEAQGFAGNTIVVLWGDHGFKLGEHGRWAKQSVLETDARVPLIIAPPATLNEKVRIGSRVEMPVELADVFPTLCDLAGLPVPESVQGISQISLMQGNMQSERPYALTQVYGPGVTGCSLRTDQWRYVEWRSNDDDRVVARELYDLGKFGREKINAVDSLPETADEQAQILSDYLGRLDRQDKDGMEK